MTETATTTTDTAAAMGTAAIERRLELRASPERVWRALTDSNEIAAWFSERADLAPEPGREGWLEWDGHGGSPSGSRSPRRRIGSPGAG